MPEQWMYDVMGDEARSRPGFEDELANELQREWRGRHSPWRAIAWGTAAAALLIGVVAVVAKDDNKQIAPADTVPSSVETLAPSTSTPATTAAHVAIGESVMVGAVQLLTDAGVVVDARENRGAQGAARAIEAAVDAGSIGAGTVVLVQVGTNAPFSSAELDDILAAVP
ncbi:MAG: hypothetical protein Q8M22_02135, partial [Actinomycetota bacterium]|nr:hypothetical protein [Actinomycetota bacterium]